MSDLCPMYAPFFGVMGCTSAIVFSCMGASYGTAKSSIGISATAILRPDMMVKMCIPVVMAGILAIYGLVVSVIMVPELHQNVSLSRPHPTWCGSLCWPRWSRGRIFHRHHRRQRRQRYWSATQTLCGHDVDVDLCGGIGDLWDDRRTPSKCQRPRVPTLLMSYRDLTTTA